MRTGPLRVEARMPDGPRRVEVELTNVGDAPVVVNDRLAPGYRDSSSRELFADVFAPGTDTVVAAEAMAYERHPPQRDDYRELAPGETLAGDFDLVYWYRLPGAGVYELVVHYQADEPLSLDVAGLLKGTHASARVPFSTGR